MHRKHLKKVKFTRAILPLGIIIAMVAAFLCGFTVANQPSSAPVYTEAEMSDWTEGQKYAHLVATAAREEGLSEDHQIIAGSQEFWFAEQESKATAEEAAATLHQLLYNGILPYEVTYDQEWEEAAACMAKAAWGEYSGHDLDQYAAVMWVVLNRYDKGYSSVKAVVSAPHQFNYGSGYGTVKKFNDKNTPDIDLMALARDVCYRYRLEQSGLEDVGRILPAEYRYFGGHDGKNWFRTSYENLGEPKWDFSLESPYTA